MADLVQGEEEQDEGEDHPGQVAVFPKDAACMIFGLFGVQSRDQSEARQWADELHARLGRGDGEAKHIERGRFVDRWGYHTELVMGYFLGEDAYADAHDADFRAWWDALPCDAGSDIGFFKEVAHCPKDYFEYATGGPDRVAAAALLELQGSGKFGYWGAYRDRIPASIRDKFLPSIEKMPQERNDATKGRRLTVTTPDNMCFIREGQGHANTGPEEREYWDTTMDNKVNRWIQYLGDDPAKTGCISIRNCEEYEVETGETNERYCQNAFLISLSHIERAARTVCAHVELRGGLFGMFSQATFVPQMHLYVEVLILQSDDMEIEYVNCHPKTGFLRFFEGRDVT